MARSARRRLRNAGPRDPRPPRSYPAIAEVLVLDGPERPVGPQVTVIEQQRARAQALEHRVVVTRRDDDAAGADELVGVRLDVVAKLVVQRFTASPRRARIPCE